MSIYCRSCYPAYPLDFFLILPAVIIIFVGAWALIVGVVKLYQDSLKKMAVPVPAAPSVFFSRVFLYCIDSFPCIFGEFVVAGGIAASIVSFMIRGEQKAA